MSGTFYIISFSFLVLLAVFITYYDVRYRRIPNAFVLAALVSGLSINAGMSGLSGVWESLTGCLLAFALMLVLHIFGAMGAGDVKLFAAIGSMLGAGMVLPTFVVVMLTGGLLGVFVMLRAGSVRETMMRVLQILVGLLPGWPMPRFSVPADRRHTIPYGVAITAGSLISLALFHA